MNHSDLISTCDVLKKINSGLSNCIIPRLLFILTFFSLAVLFFCPNPAYPALQKELLVATKEAPPFSMKNEEGEWSGISIELWREIANELNLPYRFTETDLPGMLEGLKNKKFDAAVAALTVTQQRETDFDFSHPLYTTGLGIAVKQQAGGWTAVLSRFFSLDFLKVVFLLAIVLVIFGFLIWLTEKKKNQEQFGGTAKGIGNGFWWAAVTMTTVGYGDKAPRTFWGRLIAIIWMFTAIIIISGFTAAITSSLTVSRLSSTINGPEDLPNHRVASVAGSTSERYLQANRISYVNYGSVEEGLRAAASGEADCMVYDAPILQYYIAKKAHRLSVLKQTFEQQYYAIGLVQNSALREDINRVLLEILERPWWQDILYKYTGSRS